MSKLMPNGILSPVHLGNSMNSPKDDYAFIINKEKREGYFSSNRAGGKGDDDIYYFKEDIPAVIVCDQTINVLVKNKKTGEVMPDAFVKITSNEDILIDNLTTNEEGLFKFNANCLTNYKITGSKRFFIENSKLVKTTNQNNIEQTVILELLPDEFIVVRDRVMIDINTIYFDYDKYNIRHDAALELDKVVAIMKKYPELKVESGSHTDSRGPDSYNDILSDKRAKATVEYIISKGITPDRISGKGYGEKQLTNKCSNGVRCPEDAHQLNRRTEFVIINPEVIN
jgi:outer membrane protein OmpA-like peptidoglycan-associated protein